LEERQADTETETENLADTEKEDEAVNALTAHFRRTSRGRIVELPRWAQ
jgi:hypothetical protein